MSSGFWPLRGTGDGGQRAEGRGQRSGVRSQRSKVRGQGTGDTGITPDAQVGPPTLPCALGWYGLLASGGGFWDEVKGIILERVRHGAPKEMGRGE